MKKKNKELNAKLGKRDEYDIEIIGDNVYRIHEFGAANCYLVVGTEKALLIDTGNGLGDLTKVVAGLTDLSPEVVATHSHPDHLGGMGNYKSIHIHKDDAKHAKFWSSKPLRRFYYNTVKKLIKYDITQKDIKTLKYKTRIIPIEDGHIFHLGGKTVRVIHTPGHSKGSIVLLDEEDKIMFTGDNVNPTLLHIIPGSTTIEDWLPGAKKILALADEYRAYNGHDDGISTKQQIAKLVSLGEQLIKEHPSKKDIRGIRFYPERKIRPRIIYKPWTVTNSNASETNDVSESNDVPEIKDISKANDVSEGNDISKTNDMSESNDMSETNDVAEGNDVSKTNDVREINDISKANDVAEGNDVSKINDMSESNVMSETNDVAKGNDVREIKDISKANDVSENDEGKDGIL